MPFFIVVSYLRELSCPFSLLLMSRPKAKRGEFGVLLFIVTAQLKHILCGELEESGIRCVVLDGYWLAVLPLLGPSPVFGCAPSGVIEEIEAVDAELAK